MDTTTLAARRERALGAGAPLFYDKPLHIVRGEGVHLFDADGSPLCRHVQQRAVRRTRQSACRRGDGAPAGDAKRAQPLSARRHRCFAERLAALHGPAIESVIFSCRGTEANEVALRMARVATGKHGIVCTNATYHGNSERSAR